MRVSQQAQIRLSAGRECLRTVKPGDMRKNVVKILALDCWKGYTQVRKIRLCYHDFLIRTHYVPMVLTAIIFYT